MLHFVWYRGVLSGRTDRRVRFSPGTRT